MKNSQQITHEKIRNFIAGTVCATHNSSTIAYITIYLTNPTIFATSHDMKPGGMMKDGIHNECMKYLSTIFINPRLSFLA